MAVTLTVNYKDIFSAETVEKIEQLIEESYDLEAMIIFIDEHNEEIFVHNYEDYVRMGEEVGYEAIDAYVADYGFNHDFDTLDERYVGHYQSTADFAEEWVSEVLGEHFPQFVVIDWEATWDCNFRYDFTAVNDGSTYCPIHIFRDN